MDAEIAGIDEGGEGELTEEFEEALVDIGVVFA